jgi:hypothetical protein
MSVTEAPKRFRATLVPIPKPRRLRGIRKYLRATGNTWTPQRGWGKSKVVPPKVRTRVFRQYTILAESAGLRVWKESESTLPPQDGKMAGMLRRLEISDRHRAVLADAIFSIETVIGLNYIRNRIYDELGINEHPSWSKDDL